MKLFLSLALLIANISFGYPQAIVHGYQNCVTCHATNDGGDTLRDYGRGMSEAFMSTFSNEGEAREFLGLGEADWIDLGFDYRNLEVTNVNTLAKDKFPMYSTAQLVIRHAGLSVLVSAGRYGRDRDYQTRQYWVNYNVNSNGHSLDFKLGYWLPVAGLGSNNHDLFIKKAQGFGRGQERFIRQVSYLNGWFEVRQLTAYRDFQLKKRDDNFLSVKSEKPAEDYLELKFKKIEGIDFGIHRRTEAGEKTLEGFSLRLGKGRAYLLGQSDQNPKTRVKTSYLRTGLYVFQGFDAYLERQTLESTAGLQEIKAVGFSWMFRPRLEYEGSLSQFADTQSYIGSMKLWL